eukprot:2975973-Prymnesium_polylepis.1
MAAAWLASLTARRTISSQLRNDRRDRRRLIASRKCLRLRIFAEATDRRCTSSRYSAVTPNNPNEI